MNEIDEKLKQYFGVKRRKEDYRVIRQRFTKFLLEGKQYEFDEPIETLSLPAMPYKVLKRNDINTVGQLLSKDKAQLLKLKRMGVASIKEIKEKVHKVLGYECLN